MSDPLDAVRRFFRERFGADARSLFGAGLVVLAVLIGLDMTYTAAKWLFPAQKLEAVDAHLKKNTPGPFDALPGASPTASQPTASQPPVPLPPAANGMSADAEPAANSASAKPADSRAAPATPVPQAASSNPAALPGIGTQAAGADPARSSSSLPRNAASGRSQGEAAHEQAAQPSPRPAGVAEAKVMNSLQRTLARAGASPEMSGAMLGLQPFSTSRGGLLFQPAAIQAAGGRLGQGSISMEQSNGATASNFDPQANGATSAPPTTPPGPSLNAGPAPAIPSRHVPYIIQAAQQAGIDPGLLAATAARESHFADNAYRAEPGLRPVLWSAAPGGPRSSYFDGSIGPTQVLRSNFIAHGIDDDQQAYNLTNNYRLSAQIIRGNINSFPGNEWKAIAAYNVGTYGASIGEVPTGGYTDTILAWQKDYDQALQPYVH